MPKATSWKGKFFHDSHTGHKYPMCGPFTYVISGTDKKYSKNNIRFIPEAREHALKILQTTNSKSAAARAVGCSTNTLERWAWNAGMKEFVAPSLQQIFSSNNKKPSNSTVEVSKTIHSTVSTNSSISENDVNKAFLACYMYKNNFSHSEIRQRLKISSFQLNEWLIKFGFGTSQLKPEHRVEIMLSNEKSSVLAKKYQVPVGLINLLKNEAKALKQNKKFSVVNIKSSESREAYDAVVLNFVTEQNKPISASTVRENVGGTKNQVRASLNRLIEAGKLTYDGVTRATVYMVA